jgi:alpha-1,3-fucosyltransferase
VSNKTTKSTATIETTGKPKQILLWTTFFRWDDFRFGLGREPFMAAGCRYTNCLTTTDKSLANDSDALIFHPNDFNVDNLPRHRLAAQRYVFLYYEAMASERERLSVFTEPLKHFFNWTMTHRRDSDIFSSHPYGSLRRKSTSVVSNVLPRPLPEGEIPPDPIKMFDTFLHLNMLGNKTKLVAWFNSNCDTLGGREKYFREMAQYTPIDTYGACGHLKCDPAEGTHCDKLLGNYKFYIAAENSLCADYVTEKFYRALEADVVPIVYGGADYSAYAPALSYINTADFTSPKALAEYLYVLDTNPGLYSKYFDWKKDWEVIRFPPDGWCNLCEKLNRPEEPEKSYEDIGTWFYDKVPCLPGSSLKNLYGEK